MHCDNGLAPLLLVVLDSDGIFAIEHGPVAAQRYAALLQDLCQDFIPATLLLEIDTKEMGPREVLVLAKHPPQCHDLVERSAREDEAAASMCENGLLLGPHRRSKVMRRLGIECGQKAVQVVIVDVRVEFHKDVPLRLGLQV